MLSLTAHFNRSLCKPVGEPECAILLPRQWDVLLVGNRYRGLHGLLPAACRLLVQQPLLALAGTGRAECNLPSLCHQCRGGTYGTERPPADLMSPIPCGWCRCASDLEGESLVTLPPQSDEAGATP